jgi:hypothetical protein
MELGLCHPKNGKESETGLKQLEMGNLRDKCGFHADVEHPCFLAQKLIQMGLPETNTVMFLPNPKRQQRFKRREMDFHSRAFCPVQNHLLRQSP